MNLNLITVETLKETLKAWKNYQKPPADLLNLTLLGSSNSDLLKEREKLLQKKLKKIGFETLARHRAARQPMPAPLNNEPVSLKEVLQGLETDFSLGNAELKAWSAVYHIYLIYLGSPEFNLSLSELANITMAAKAVDKESQFRRHLREGLNRLVTALQEAELDAHQQPREWSLPAPDYNDKLFGAEETITQVLNWLETPNDIGPLFISIEALGGWGKTAIARAVASKFLKSGTFAEIVWISARHEELTDAGKIRQLYDPARSTDDIITRLAEKFAPGHSVGVSREHKIERLKAVLADKTCLIIIDNLETLSDTKDLLPAIFPLAGKTRFLLTSRHPLGEFAYVQCIRVPELSHQNSVALIQSELQRRDRKITLLEDEMKKIYGAIGGVPLALKLVASQMTKLPLAHILEGLHKAKQKAPEAMYTYIYHRTWQELLDEPARLLLLSLQHIPLEGEDQAWIYKNSQLPKTNFDAALKQLLDYALLEIAGPLDAPLYHLHRLTITFLKTEILLGWQE
jgi:hypothetical protein